MSVVNRGIPSGPRRGQQQRVASGARTAPYSRPETSRTVSADDRQWPPTQISIRGRSGPTYVVVSNLLKGTTEDDILETFQQFGEIEDVLQRKAPTDNYPSIAFEIGFASRTAASTAIAKLDGALADGRILQLTYRDASKLSTGAEAAHPSRMQAQIPSAVVSTHKELMPSIPSGPRLQQQQQQPINHPRNVTARELLNAKPHQRPAVVAPSLQSRLMTPAQLRALQKQQARAAQSLTGVPKGPKGAALSTGAASAVPLAKRITLPLAMRLSAEAKKNGPASSLATVAAAKKRRQRGKGKGKSANGMDVD